MAGDSFVLKLGEIWISCDSGKCLIMIFFEDGTVYIVREFDEGMDPMDLFKRWKPSNPEIAGA